MKCIHVCITTMSLYSYPDYLRVNPPSRIVSWYLTILDRDKQFSDLPLISATQLLFAAYVILLLWLSGISDLSDVLEAVWEARSKWYNIGLKLGTSSGTLDAIKASAKENVDDCVTTMIKDWLNNGKPQPTWAAVAKALKSPMVGCKHLAEQLPA